MRIIPPRTRDCKGGEAVPERSGGMEVAERTEPCKARFFAKQKMAPTTKKLAGYVEHYFYQSSQTLPDNEISNIPAASRLMYMQLNGT